MQYVEWQSLHQDEGFISMPVLFVLPCNVDLINQHLHTVRYLGNFTVEMIPCCFDLKMICLCLSPGKCTGQTKTRYLEYGGGFKIMLYAFTISTSKPRVWYIEKNSEDWFGN